jgi:PAS domain S-box-containing protein
VALQLLAVAISAEDQDTILKAFASENVVFSSKLEHALCSLKQQSIDVLLLDMDTLACSINILPFLLENDEGVHPEVLLVGSAPNPMSSYPWYLEKPLEKEKLEDLLDQIQAKREAAFSLKQQASLFRALFWQAPIGIAISHGVDTLKEGQRDSFSVNPRFEEITGWSERQLQHVGWASITHPDDVERDLQQFMLLKQGVISSYSMDKRYIRPDGSFVWVHMVVASLSFSYHGLSTHICLVQDLSERIAIEQDLRESERSKAVLLANLPGMAYRCLYDVDWTMLYVSEGCHALTGYSAQRLLYNRGLSFNSLIVPEYRSHLVKAWEKTVQNRLPFTHEYEIVTAQGARKWVWEIGQPIFREDGSVEALEGMILDITDRKRMEEKLIFQDEHDPVTGLYNRKYLEKFLEQEDYCKEGILCALISLNLNTLHAKSITYGYQYSQDLMKKLAKNLMKLASDDLLICITHEYRFAIYCRGYQSREMLLDLCKTIEAILQEVLSLEQVQWGFGILELQESQGYSVEQLLRNLMVASEHALSVVDHEASPCFFDRGMEGRINREKAVTLLVQEIIASPSDERFFLHFQPIMHLKSNKIVGFEALSRLQSTELGLISPLEFIPIAEKTKMILPLGQIIMRQAFSFLKILQKKGYERLSVSINISAIQLLNPDFVRILMQYIKEMEVDPSLVVLEITESIFASNYQEINRILGTLQEQGIRIAVDDFGTGYSSLARERELHVNILKIDKFFIDKLLVLTDQQAITGDIVSMAHKLGHTVVAEGIEFPKQMEYLRRVGCDMMQGYLLSKPVCMKEALAFLEPSSLKKGK